MIYRTRVTMSFSEFQRVNRLLEIESLPNLSEEEMYELNAKHHADELLFIATFENGVKLELHLVSGSENYFTSPIFYLPDGSVRDPEDASEFELDVEENFTLDNDEYIICIYLTSETEEWVILAEDSNGKIHFYHRITNNKLSFIKDVRSLPQSMNIIAVYKQKDVVEGVQDIELKI